MTDETVFMKEAIRMARRAQERDEVPIGAVIVRDGKVIARGWNDRETHQKSTGHAEINAIDKACRKLGTWRLDDCDLYVTLEPCPMCAGAIIQSRIRRVYFGAWDPKSGSAGSAVDLFAVPQYNHHPEVHGGLLEEECAELLKSFFREKRKQKKKNRIIQENE